MRGPNPCSWSERLYADEPGNRVLGAIRSPGVHDVPARICKRTEEIWPTLLRRTFDIDVLTCAKCGGRLRILAVLTRPHSVRAILDRLDLSPTPPTAPARDPTDLVDPNLDA